MFVLFLLAEEGMDLGTFSDQSNGSSGYRKKEAEAPAS